MARVMSIDPRGTHWLRKVSWREEPLKAHLRKTDAGVRIEFSDGRGTNLNKDPLVSMSTFVAAAVQWARRHGAVIIEVDI